MESMLTDQIEAAAIRKVYWRLIPLLFVMVFINYLDRINIGFAQLNMGKQLDISDAAFGFASSIFFVGYMVLEVPSNLMLHRFGARRWIVRILLTWGVVAAATAFVFNDTSLYVMRVLLGAMEAGFLPGVAVYLTKWIPASRRAWAFGGYIIGSTVAGVLGGPISTAIMTYADHLLGLHGWQWMFIAEGAAAILVGLLALRFMTERPAEAKWLTPQQRDWLESTLEAERAALGEQRRIPVLSIVSDIRVWSLAILFGCSLVGIYGLLLWLPQIIKSLGHLSSLQVGFLSAVPPLVGVLGTLVVSRRSDRTGDRKKHLAFVYGVSAIAIAASAYVPNHVAAYLLLCVAGLVYAGNPIFWSLASSFRAGAAGAATIALINTVAQFGGLVGPWSIGLIRGSTGSFALALVTIAAFLVVATVIALAMRVSGTAAVSPEAAQALQARHG
jgi:MFS transporter, ACS family, tartrate transporter